MLAPKAFEQELCEQTYVAGRYTAASKTGAIRFTVPVCFAAMALVIYGVRAFYSAVLFPALISYWLSGALILLTGVGLALVWLVVLPRRIRRQAAADYAHYRALYGRTAVHFEQDDMTLTGEMLTFRVAFAKTRLCVETNDLFVILTDDNDVVLLEKAAFTAPEDTVAFLRDVFARWYVRKR